MGPNLRNCPQCGRLFAYQGRDICNKCLEKEDDDYAVVRKYVRDHPGSSVVEVAEATGIDEEKVLQFLRDGRLLRKGVDNPVCERCGKNIASGKYCDKCLRELDMQIKGVMPVSRTIPEPESKPQGKSREKMYIRSDNSD